MLPARQRCLSARWRLARMKRAKGSRRRRRAGLIWRRGSGSAWKSIAPDATKTSGQNTPGAKQCGECQQGYDAETSNNFVTALTKPAPRSVCFGATGPPEGWPRVDICQTKLLERFGGLTARRRKKGTAPRSLLIAATNSAKKKRRR